MARSIPLTITMKRIGFTFASNCFWNSIWTAVQGCVWKLNRMAARMRKASFFFDLFLAPILLFDWLSVFLTAISISFIWFFSHTIHFSSTSFYFTPSLPLSFRARADCMSVYMYVLFFDFERYNTILFRFIFLYARIYLSEICLLATFRRILSRFEL